MRKKEFFKVIIALCLALMLFACEVNPGGGGSNGGQNGNNGNNGTGGPGDGVGYRMTLKLVEAGETFISLEWTPLEGVKSYSVSVKNIKDGKAYWLLYRGSETKCTISDLVPGETYYIHASEEYLPEKGYASVSNEIAVKTTAPSLVALTGIKYEVNAYEMSMSWNPVEGAAYYKVYREDVSRWVYSMLSRQESAAIRLLDLGEKDMNRNYRVVAYSADGKRASAFSETVNVKLRQPTLELWPIKDTVTSYEVSFSWDSLPNEHMIDVMNGADNFIMTREFAGSTGYYKTDVKPGEKLSYRFRLKRTTTGDASPYSKIYNLTIPQPELAQAPANFELVSLKEKPFSKGYYTADISWEKVPSAEKYYVFIEYPDGSLYKFAEVGENSCSIEVSNRTNPSITLRVKAVNHTTQKGSDYSQPFTVSIPK